MSIFSFLKGMNKYYFNIFLALLLSIVITLFIVSSVLYLFFVNIGMNLINTYESRNLSKVSYSTTFMMDWTKMLAYQIYQDRDIKKLLYDSSPAEDEKNISYMRLASYRNSTPHINSIYVYNGVSKNIYYDTNNSTSYSTTDFFDKEIFNMINKESRVKHLLPTPRKIKSDPSNEVLDNTYNVYTFVFYEYPSRRLEQDNIIVINLSENWMRNIIDSLDSNASGDTFILNSQGQTVISTENMDMLTDISGSDYIQRILTTQTPSGYFVEEVNGVKSMVSYVSSNDNRIDWKYVSVIPYKIITKKIDAMRNYTILIGFCILLLGLTITYYASGKLYKPIDTLLGDLKKLRSEKQGSLHTLKQEYLRNLLKVGSQYHTNTILGEHTDFKINLDTSRLFIVVVLKIDHYAEFCNAYTHSDRNLFRFAIINIAEELFSEHYQCECIDTETDHITVLLNAPNDILTSDFEKLTTIIINTQASVMKHLQISMSAVHSSVRGTSIDQLPGLYAQLLEHANFRLYEGHGCVINSDRLQSENFDEYSYPLRKEETLINALILKKNNEVKNTFDEIINKTKDYHYSALTLTILRLTLAINAAIDTMEKNSGISIAYNFNEFISSVNKLETIDEISNHFYSMFDHINAKMILKKSSSHEELVNSIIERIETQYSNLNLSIDVFASEFDMSPVYLGRVFKQLTLKSIAEYINDVRIEKAKSLLALTDKTINEIAESVGFSNSNYLYTLFRKLNGVTPSEFRELNRKKP